MLDLISDVTMGTPEDKMRLFIIYYILTPNIPETELVQYEAALKDAGADTNPLNYLKKWK